jgi:hypothetical protein
MIKIFLFSLLFFNSPIYSKPPDFYKSWSLFLGEFSEALTGITNSQTLTQLLFNSFSDISSPVYSFKVPELPVDIGFGIDVGGGRQVIYNQSIDNSYTVIDKILVGVRPELGGVYSGVKVGVRTRINFFVTNVRQIGPTEYDILVPLDKKYEDLKEAFRKEKLRSYSSAEIQVDNEQYSSFMPSGKEKIERNATLGKIWNPLTMTFRLPLTPHAAERLAPNELLGYTILGGIELAAGFGVSLDPAAQILRTGVDASVYFKGIYEIVVLREKPEKPGDNFFRVKIGRHKGVGYQLGMGSEGYTGIDQLTKGHMGPLEGNFVWSLAGFFVSVRPFRIEWDQSYWWLFNQVYRFDLNNPEARKAFQKAVLGRFKIAQNLAMDEKGNLRENAPVTRILTEKEKRNLRGHRNSIKLFLFNLQKEGVIRNSDKILIDEKGEEHHISEAETISSRYWNFLFAISEKRSHSFLITTQLKEFQKEIKKPEAMILVVEAIRSDSQTTAKEYIGYVSEVEGALNIPGFFPAPPRVREKDKLKPVVGNINISYQLKFNWPQMEKLINYPEEKMWPALITAFNAKGLGWEDPKTRKKLIAKAVGIYMGTVPVTIVGSKFPSKDNIIIASIKYNLWIKLKNALLRGPKELTEELGKFFKSGDYGPEMVKLLRVVLDGEKVPYKIRGFNPLLGSNPNFSEDQIGDIRNPVDQSMDPNLDLYKGDFEKVTVSNLISEIISNQYIRFIFDLDKDPYSLFFNVQKVNLTGSLTNVSLGAVVMENKNKIFKKGRNIIMVKIGDNRHPLNNLINQMEVKKSLTMPNQYRIDIAGSLDGKKYGWTTSNLFRLIYTQDPKSLKKFINYSIQDFNLCMGRTALNLILFLEKRPLLVCPENAPRHQDGTCETGMYPYDHFNNRPIEENLVKRDAWILTHCPVEGNEEFITKTIAQNNVCMGKKASELISFLGNRILYICPPADARNPDGTCVTGMVPYQLHEEGDNTKARNNWILKYCPN